MSKDNIMKFTDGIFHKTFDSIAKEYPQINTEHYIIDIGSARLATKPDIFEVIVTSNLYGDIISDIVAETSGSVGLAGSANIGTNYAMFEAIHGSAPDIAGKNIANPSGLLNAAVMMFAHFGLGKYANLIENAWKKTLEDGMHTTDIYREGVSNSKLGTKEFAKEVIKRLGQKPSTLREANYADKVEEKKENFSFTITQKEKKSLVGVDVYFDWIGSKPSALAELLKKADLGNMELQMIAAKGLKVWPMQADVDLMSDHFRARFFHKNGSYINHEDVISLLKALEKTKLDFIKVENLYKFDDQIGYSLSQGE